jgi:hypothetical protein
MANAGHSFADDPSGGSLITARTPPADKNDHSDPSRGMFQVSGIVLFRAHAERPPQSQ